MNTRTAAIAAALGMALLLTGCVGGNEPEEVAPSPEAEAEVPSPTVAAKDALAACGVVMNGGDDSVLVRIPASLIGIQAELDDARVNELLDINAQLVQAIEQAPPAMAATLRSLQAPFQQVQDVVDAGGGNLSMDTSGVAGDVTTLMGQCVDEGFKVS